MAQQSGGVAGAKPPATLFQAFGLKHPAPGEGTGLQGVRNAAEWLHLACIARGFPLYKRMPEWFDVLILAIIEGLTEFIPVSSTGHMLLAENWLTHQQSELFLAVVQCGAVLAVILVFSERVKQMFLNWRDHETQQFILKLAGAFALTVAGALVLKKLKFVLPKDPMPIALATLIGGFVILVIEAALRGEKLRDTVTWPVALAIGVAQLVAVIFPGASRSGTTIMMAMAFGIGRRPATEFSFLLGIPTLLAAGAKEILDAVRHPVPGEPVHWGMVLFGTVVAAIVAFIVVKWLLRFIQTHTFNGFGWYRILLGVVILVLLQTSHHGINPAQPGTSPVSNAAR
jgi:undecaprenyl-diphosphatase